MRITSFFVAVLVSVQFAVAQEPDTVKRQLEDVVITGYLSSQPIIQTPASVAVLDSKALLTGPQQSLVPVMNTIPGIRMEERSPGSYRLSIRGSLLRSPFGVRNVKIYFNDLPLTDASGNAYLNLIDPVMLQRVEILKGPDGSLFGANSGGVVLLESHLRDSSSLQGGVSGGSYGLLRQHILFNHSTGNFSWNIGEAYQRSDGYREQSAMKRLSLLGSGKFSYGQSNSVKATILFSDIQYETPGGLTEEQFNSNPRQARPSATAPSGDVIPGAIENKTAIYNTTLYGGITNELHITRGIRHLISVFGTTTDYENPSIRSYEIRKEKNGGVRTYLAYSKQLGLLKTQLYAGMEGQWGAQEFFVHANNFGQQGLLDSVDRVSLSQLVYFSRFTLDIADKLTAEVAVSLNEYKFSFAGLPERKISNEWMPRLAVNYRITPELALRASISRGYSPPGIAEVRPSGDEINQTLEAEWGWNKEIGTRFSILNGRLEADASIFRYNLENAIVVRKNSDNSDFFLNSGGTKQTGVELLMNAILIANRATYFIRNLSLHASFAYSQFEFDNYRIQSEDYSGNRVTGVPRTTVVTGLSIDLPQRINVFVQSNFTSNIPLNDANSEYADRYELLQARIGWKPVQQNKLVIELFMGGDNLLNQKYSLGNDLNAAGDRYFNAAPLRNFYGGINVTLP